ncbi:hypothetical protein VTL71DRAFT_2012 [Oculimacula yallundae]|uniref:Uncharacterized protein n=1 Tax=Oculimacula yallundae TaxID=86028 RepID=A0ABR4CD38_9HELO
MIGMKSLAACAAVFSVVYATALPAPEDEWHVSLLKRQAPGTPAFACHSACGTAITLSRGASPCTNEAFLTDYAACLACAGPSDQNIWRYYGGTLTTAGTACGLSTTPGAAPPAAVTSSSVPTTSSPAPEPTSSSTETSASSVVSSIISSTVSQSSSLVAYSTLSTPVASVSVSTTAAPTYAPSSTVAATTSAANSTSTTVPFTGGANSAGVHMAGAFVAVAGAVFAAVL